MLDYLSEITGREIICFTDYDLSVGGFISYKYYDENLDIVDGRYNITSVNAFKTLLDVDERGWY